ncbi:hypothetical protein JKP88DRAFT_281297 [Tribonema minus]|uniref:Uncharacterized protein n=1 Tax=Tribonema minus TaxID=303371 RepID=A0A836CA37_9STRA|nr:hypothetical protein JKP88DRAFT_281297 [Tribonema minus]
MAWSSFYGVMDMDDAWRDVNIETHVWIDLQIVLFGIACMGFGFATVGSVFYLLAANEAGTASKVHSLQAHFGHWLSAPWYFFFTGLFGWGSGFYVQGCVAARTTAAMVVFLVIMLSGTAIFIWSMRECVSGVFTVQRISEDHRPITHTLGHIQAQFRQYAAEVGAENISHDEFRLFLVRPVGHLNYWPGLSAVCQARVDRVFEEELQKAVETSSAAPITLRLAEIRLQFVKYSKQVGSDNIRRAAFTDHLARPAEPGGDVVCLSEVCVARANKVFDEELQKVVDGDDDDSSELSVVTPLMLTPTD